MTDVDDSDVNAGHPVWTIVAMIFVESGAVSALGVPERLAGPIAALVAAIAVGLAFTPAARGLFE